MVSALVSLEIEIKLLYLSGLSGHKNTVYFLEGAIKKFWGFEATLIVDIEFWKYILRHANRFRQN